MMACGIEADGLAAVERADLRRRISEVVRTLKPQEAAVLRAMYGSVTETFAVTEIAAALGWKQAYARYVHSKALRKLRHPSRANVLREFTAQWSEQEADRMLPKKKRATMNSRFASVRSDDDPRYPGMVVATVREPRDMVAFPIGAQHTHDGVAMKVVGRDANIGTVRLRPIPNAPARPSGPVHLAAGFSDEDRTCAGEGGSLSTNVGEVECVACLDAALAEAERQVAEYTARKAALKGPA